MCPFRPEMRGTERPLQNRAAQLVFGFVQAARFLGGQFFARASRKKPIYVSLYGFQRSWISGRESRT
jgi:hypothetical protein